MSGGTEDNMLRVLWGLRIHCGRCSVVLELVVDLVVCWGFERIVLIRKMLFEIFIDLWFSLLFNEFIEGQEYVLDNYSGRSLKYGILICLIAIVFKLNI